MCRVNIVKEHRNNWNREQLPGNTVRNVSRGGVVLMGGTRFDSRNMFPVNTRGTLEPYGNSVHEQAGTVPEHIEQGTVPE